MAAGASLVRGVASRLGRGVVGVPLPRRVLPRSAAVSRSRSQSQATSLEDDHCSAFLHWLQSKAGTRISSVLAVATSSFGRSLVALEPIKEGDCILEVPYSVQLTEDKLPQEVCMLLDNLVGDTAKVAVLLMMEQHLGHESGWETYIKSLPCKDELHNVIFWDLNELNMVRNSSVYNEAIEQREQAKKEFSATKPVLERFPHLFGEIKLEDFMHASALVSSRAWRTSRGVSLIPFADFLNHDGFSNSILLYDKQKDVSEVIADRNYAVGEQVMIRYGKYSNAALALNFGFTLSSNIYDQAHIRVDMPYEDPFYRKKLDIWKRHHGPKYEDMFCCSYNETFVIKELKFCGGKGMGVPQILRAFFRVFHATSLEELEEMSTEAARDDGRLARRPLGNTQREIHAHRMLLLHLDDEIQRYLTAIEHLEIANDPASRSVHPVRKDMAKDILDGELRVLQSARAWVASYCETSRVSGQCLFKRLDLGQGEGSRDRMLQRAASNAYSWWWASHIRTKQSKWLDNHLQDMEHRVKCMLLLLGEEADSFSKRAEMYYKRRPEVITQVEEVYRAYRALADRYDIMSGELHKANHTIATAFPDQVQYAMLEEEDDNIPKAFTPVDPRKIHKSTVDGLMKKKKGEHPGSMVGGAKNSSSAPINKENAREEISRLQKAILVMQTEKEFIKSSYESGIAKYWDLEKEINDMQEQVCHFQDKFDESAVIEDDEARALMTATALKSCEDTIVKLQEQRKASAGQAVGESERVRVFREKLNAIMNKHGKSLPDSSDFSEKNTRKNHGAEMEDVCHVKQGAIDTQAVIDKIKEHFERDCDISMAEITERIDEIVNKVVDLDLMVSSQTSQIDRLCQENNQLENSLQSLEDENTELASGSSELIEKLRQAEEELVRAQALESSFHKDESTIRSNFIEAISRFHDISELLLSPVCEDHTDSASAPHTSHEDEGPQVESIEASSNECCDMEKVGLQIAEPPADNAVPVSDVAANDESSGSTKCSEQQLEAGQDKSSRERGSLVRLRHISSDNLGGCEEEEEMSKEGLSSSADAVTDMMKLQERLTDSLDNKEKVLLGEYTSLLEDYKDAKRKLAEIEKKNQDCLNEIRRLREEITSSAGEGGSELGSCKRNSSSFSRRAHRRTPSYWSIHQRKPSVSSISRMIRMGSAIQGQGGGEPAGSGKPNDAAAEQGGIISMEDLRLPAIPEAGNASPLEEKFRKDIDTLLDENLEFWMKFSSSLQRVQEFQNKHDGLQRKLQLINDEDGKHDGATEKQLRAFKTELQVWSEQNAMLRGELQCRFTSLCDIQEEITAALDTEAETEAEAEEAQFTSYQAAKFQGEVLNMQQENNRVSDELQGGLDRIKGLQAEVEQALAKLHRSVTLPPQPTGAVAEDDDSGSPAHGGRNLGHASSNKSTVPLQSFLFPAKPKKTSLLARVTPVLPKQPVDMKFLVKLPR